MGQGTDELWTLDDLAAFLRVKVSVARFWLRSTDVPYIKIGKQIRFDPDEIKSWVEGQKVRQMSGVNELRRI